MVINKNTDVDKCIDVALSQHFNDSLLRSYYDKNNINSKLIDMHEEQIFEDTDNLKSETDVGSCDRWNLLYCMLKVVIQKAKHLMVTFKVIDMNLYLIYL